MAKRLTITFPPDRPYEYHGCQVFWFAEAPYRSIVQAGLGTLNDVDRGREVVWIDLNNKHDLGKVKFIVRKLLGKYKLTADATVPIK